MKASNGQFDKSYSLILVKPRRGTSFYAIFHAKPPNTMMSDIAFDD